ncbi:YqzE family protein [Paenibacillus medicaginis]|uniref:YqzE family protein n=1 Tax=Paenibacillus medicaginis TaxID=1470560 RepID=A0ABV5BZ66_9BACL
MAKGDELVRYITEQVVKYIELPRDVRRARRMERESWRTKWFGMLPFSFSMWLKSSRSEDRKQKAGR